MKRFHNILSSKRRGMLRKPDLPLAYDYCSLFLLGVRFFTLSRKITILLISFIFSIKIFYTLSSRSISAQYEQKMSSSSSSSLLLLKQRKLLSFLSSRCSSNAMERKWNECWSIVQHFYYRIEARDVSISKYHRTVLILISQNTMNMVLVHQKRLPWRNINNKE